MISIYSTLFVILLCLKLTIKPALSWFIVFMPVVIHLLLLFILTFREIMRADIRAFKNRYK